MTCEHRKKAIIESCNLFGWSCVSTYEQLPERIKIFYSFLPYREIIRPLIRYHRNATGLSYRQIGIKYGYLHNAVYYLDKETTVGCKK